MSNQTKDIITPEDAVTLYGLFKERVKRTPDTTAYSFNDEMSRSWKTCSWTEMDVEVQRWRTALSREELSPGDRVAIGLCNCKEWVIMDQAALGLGLVVVPLFCNDHPENVAYILNNAEVKLLLLDNEDFWLLLNAVPEKPETLVRVITIGKFKNSNDDRMSSLHEWLPEQGDEITPPASRADGLATIVYTSGTTGLPKGVELSHHNILWNAVAGIESVPVYREDLFLSFLPLSHTFERTVGYYIPMMAGASVVYTRSVKELAKDLLSVRPTLLVSVPRIFERVYGKIMEELEKKPAIIGRLFQLAVAIGWKRFEHMQKREMWSMAFLLWPLLDRLVAQKIRDRFGGCLRAVVVGGAPLPSEISKVFIGLGLPLLQGYGMTEASPVVSVNMIDNNIPSSVGIPYRDVQVKIGNDDELLVRSPGIMLGYLNNQEATAEAIDKDCWLHTGDKARIDKGHIFITGRIKEIIVLANGEKVPPHDIEMAIDMDPLINQVMVVGEGKPYLAALVVLNPEKYKLLAAERGLAADNPESLKDAGLEKLVLTRIASRMSSFPGYAEVRRAAFIHEPWTVENELITPTLKLRRKKILERYDEQIHSLYEGHEIQV